MLVTAIIWQPRLVRLLTCINHLDAEIEMDTCPVELGTKFQNHGEGPPHS